MEIRETHEHVEQAHERENKRAGLLIIIIAAVLAVTEMAGKETQFAGLAANIERSDLFSFYQAKRIRSAVERTAAESAEITVPEAARSEAWTKQTTAWREEVARLESDPKTGEGTRELLAKAKEKEVERDREVLKYHALEYAAAVLQLAIVLASASILVGMGVLELAAVVFGLIGLGLALAGGFAPELLPFL